MSSNPYNITLKYQSLRLNCINENPKNMRIFKENKPHQLSVWYLQIDRLKRSGRNLDELNECLLTRRVVNKKNSDSLFLPCYHVSAPRARYDVKILP